MKRMLTVVVVVLASLVVVSSASAAVVGPRVLWADSPASYRVELGWGHSKPYGVMGSWNVACVAPVPRVSSVHVQTISGHLRSVTFIVRACGTDRKMGFMASWR